MNIQVNTQFFEKLFILYDIAINSALLCIKTKSVDVLRMCWYSWLEAANDLYQVLSSNFSVHFISIVLDKKKLF
jgi:hypothetical protein